MTVLAMWWLYPLLIALICGGGEDATGPWPLA
jgi:hypothetical protein